MIKKKREHWLYWIGAGVGMILGSVLEYFVPSSGLLLLAIGLLMNTLLFTLIAMLTEPKDVIK